MNMKITIDISLEEILALIEINETDNTKVQEYTPTVDTKDI